MFNNDSVFGRTGDDTISARAYNFVIGSVLCWGFLANYFMIKTIPSESVMAINVWLLIIGYFACCMTGYAICYSSDNPLVSFFGYNMIVVPVGIIIIPFVQHQDPEIIHRSIVATGGTTFIMMMLGSMYPEFFKKISGALFVALVSAVIVELGMIFILGHSATFMDWIVVLIFCGYIGYDWGRAQQIPKTIDNAVDSAATLYLDIINLFVRIASIMGGNKD